MIVFNPKRMLLKNMDNVEICIDNGDNLNKFSMQKLENGAFGYDINYPYVNYYFNSEGKSYCTHKIEYVVVSTMSSGKSTFINSLIGRDIMPSENQACTGKIFKLESLFGEQQDVMCIRKEGKIKRFYLEEKILKDLNLDMSIDQIDIQVKYANIRNNISIYDTPGINNYQEKNHKEITYNFLKKTKIKNIIYVLNATQLGTIDDQSFLIDLKELMDKKNFKIFFIVNKIDAIDEAKENKNEILLNIKSYLEKNNFTNYLIFPLSAYYAKLIRKALNNIDLTRSEIGDLNKYYSFSEIEESENAEYISVGKFNFSKEKLEKLLIETGIIDIEKIIQNINIFQPTFSLRVL